MADGIGLIKRFCDEVIVGGNFSLIDELVLDDYFDHQEGLPGQPEGKEGLKFYVSTVRMAFPDLTVKATEPSLTDGNLECAYVTLAGTHQGDFAGIPATGRTVEFSESTSSAVRRAGSPNTGDRRTCWA
ncbi:ester cyclase [Arthrobacter sp. D1-17]